MGLKEEFVKLTNEVKEIVFTVKNQATVWKNSVDAQVQRLEDWKNNILENGLITTKVVATHLRLPQFGHKGFTTYFENGKNNMAVDLIIKSNSFWSAGTIVIGGHYSHQNINGRLEMRFRTSFNNSNTYGNNMEQVSLLGLIGVIKVDAWRDAGIVDGVQEYRCRISKPDNSYGNGLSIGVTFDGYNSGNASDFLSISEPYQI